MNRSELSKHVLDKYSIVGERPWQKYPSYEIFRHNDNKKWFAVVMRIPMSKLGVLENRDVNVVNLKCTPEVLDELRQEEGIYPAYHMNKEHWISVLLDGSVSPEAIKTLLDVSYNATKKK